jgi:hypothetical protein
MDRCKFLGSGTRDTAHQTLILTRDMEGTNVIIEGLRILVIVHEEGITFPSRPFINIVIIDPNERRIRRFSKDRSRQRGGLDRGC